MADRKIIHLDLDAFFCAVEELRDPSLRGKAFAVGGQPHERGVVASCSYAARQCGVHSAMPMGQALRLCPGLLIIPPDHAAYHDFSEQVMAILRQRTALVEQLSIDEAFLDVSDLPEPAEAVARALQAEIHEQLDLPCSLGVAANKLLAKTATDVGKAKHRGATPPRALEVVPPGQEAVYLAPLPVRALWGIGPKTAARLAELGIHTIGDIARVPEGVLTRQFGQAGREMSWHARGIDDRPVTPERAARSISQEITFDRDVGSAETLEVTLRRLSGEVARMLRQKDLCAGTIRLKLRWPDFTTLSRQVSLDQPTDQDGIIYEAAIDLLSSVWSKGRPIRLIGVGASRLVERAHQLSLWDTPDQKERRLLDALDTLRERFGDDVVRSGRAAKRSKPGDETKKKS
jgi:DNA polymerase-4